MTEPVPDPQNTDHLFYDTLPLRCPPDRAYAAKASLVQVQCRIRQARHHPSPDLGLLEHLAVTLRQYRLLDLSLPLPSPVIRRQEIQ